MYCCIMMLHNGTSSSNRSVEIVPEMTYYVLGGTFKPLNLPKHSLLYIFLPNEIVKRSRSGSADWAL